MPKKKQTTTPFSFSLKSQGNYVNLNYLKEIAGGDLNFITDIINLFLQQSPENVKNLNFYAKQKDWESLKKLAHKMRSPITLVGIEKLLELLPKLEADGSQIKTLESIPSIVNLFTEVWEKAIIELQLQLD
ncbi:MAG: hypothetical protein M3142_10665, partial [Bacteroidota bacterium]|nr:hypothetical protein [Bacteroidota bacterium]